MQPQEALNPFLHLPRREFILMMDPEVSVGYLKVSVKIYRACGWGVFKLTFARY